ncbi:MAG: MBL fold metallo-hydrolase [Candidatus Bilamarchaeaceae archaeon]
MEIVFLGTGGGRINLIRQVRWTGGFRINSTAANIHVDPGPGALLRSNQMKENPLKLDAIIVTHGHIDHCNDANVMIEAMSNYALKKKGILIGSRDVIEGSERYITKYHLGRCEEVYAPKLENDLERKTFKTKKGEFEMEFVKIKHDEPTAFGFKLKIENITVGYTSDTEFFGALPKLFKNCDYLIINVLKPEFDGIPDHLETAHGIKILKEAKPKAAIISHFGLSMLRAGPENQARIIENATGIRTIAARDGLRIKPGLSGFL